MEWEQDATVQYDNAILWLRTAVPTGVFGKEPGRCVVTMRIQRAENLSLVARPASLGPVHSPRKQSAAPGSPQWVLSVKGHSLASGLPAQLPAI